MKNKYIIALLVSLISQLVYAQLITPEDLMNRPSPSLSFKVYPHSGRNFVNKTLDDYKGKWLVLEFWTKYCSSCIAGLPKLQQLKEEFSNEANFLLIGKSDLRYGEGIENLYRKVAKEEKLTLDIAFDTIAFKTFSITTTPKVIIISPTGIVRSVTYGNELTSSSLHELFSSDRNTMAIVSHLIGRGPSKNLLFKSGTQLEGGHLSKIYMWQPGEARIQLIDLDKILNKDTLTVQQISLNKLYQLAFVGKTFWNNKDSLHSRLWPNVLIETSDSLTFKHNMKLGTGYFSYQLVRDKGKNNKQATMKMMQNDLLTWFPYKVELQTRAMPAYKLIFSGTDSSVLKSIDTITSVKGSYTHYSFKNVPIQRVVDVIYNFQHCIIEDASGIEFPISLEIDANMMNLASIQRALIANGLSLLPIKRNMLTMVITDK